MKATDNMSLRSRDSQDSTHRMSTRRHSFKTTSGRRRASVVVGSLGRAGLFTPSDFIENPTLDRIERDVESQDPEIVDEEVQLLNANGIDINKMYGLLLLLDQDPSNPSPPILTQVDSVWNEAVESHKLTKSTYLLELKHLVSSSIPLIVTFLFENSMSVASVFSVGHLGAKELLAVSLGAMTANITLYSIIQGLATSLDTLCSQAYGAGNYKLVGLHFQKCTIVIFFVFLPIFIFYWTGGLWLLQKLIPEPESAKLLSHYLEVVSLGVPGYILFETGKRFLQSQGIFHASTYILCICAPLNGLMNYLFVWNKYIGIGYLGAPIAVLINYWLMAMGLLVYTLYTSNPINPMKCWIPINWSKCFEGWGLLFKLALPGVIMIEAEFFAFELLTLLASYLGTESLALQSVVITVSALAYQVPFAISIASGTRVANLLGASLIPLLKTHAKVTLLFSILVSLCNASLIFFGRDQLARFFTNDEPTIRTVAIVVPFLAIVQIFDSLNLVSAGILRGQGLQKIGGIVNLISYYVIGLPVSILLTFKFDLGLKGLWMGAGLALFIIGVVQSYFALSADYEQLVKDLERRNNQ